MKESDIQIGDNPTAPGETDTEDTPEADSTVLNGADHQHSSEANSRALDEIHTEDGQEDKPIVLNDALIAASPKVPGKKKKSKKLYIVLTVIVLLCLLVPGLSVFGYRTYAAYNEEYHRDLSVAQVGVQHLRMAETLLKALPKNPFDVQSVNQAQHEFVAASAAFAQVNNDLQSLPGIISAIPGYGTRFSAALHLLPIALEASQTGALACSILSLVISKFHDPLNTQNQGLTMADFTVINKDFYQIKTALNLIVSQVHQLQPSDLQLDPRLSKILASFQTYLPTLQSWLGLAEKLLPVIPTLLGIGTPTNYLIELLDSTELRPGGGFMGNYGIATLSGGRVTAAHITDVYLLDLPFAASGKGIPYPAAYSWFDLSPASWSLRDSNLDADFPTVARYSEANYKLEGGNIPIQGVIAITPGFIQQALEVTGPISVPEYHETVTAQNLIDRIHHYQIGLAGEGTDVPSPDGRSSIRKHFTSLLADHFLARIRQMSSSALPQILKLLISALHTKDAQIYLNPSVAEDLLQSYHVDSSIESPSSDSLFVVNANISPNKANDLITNTLNDQVTIDASGNAIHHTTISYAWAINGNSYGANVYRDYMRVYAPPNSILQSQNGWKPRGTSLAFGREVWAGFFTLSYGKTATITLVWTAPGAAKKDAKGWHYHYLIQRQAGAQWTLHLQVMLPSCVGTANMQGGLVSSNRQTAMLTQALAQDVTVGIDYSCNT